MDRGSIDVIYASALWYGPTKVNCHYLAERLSVDHAVLFVESVGARAPRVHDWRRLVPRALRVLAPLRRVGTRLWVFSPLPLPLYAGRGARANSTWIGIQVRLAVALRGWRVGVCWVFHPFGLGTTRALRGGGSIYYCVDDYASNPGVDEATIRALERDVAREASVTLVTNDTLVERFRGVAREVRVLPNVADTELFARDFTGASHPLLAVLDALPRPRIGYLGNLAAYKIDLPLIVEIAQRKPDWSLVLVGPRNLGDVDQLVRAHGVPSNVHFMEAVPHDLAPAVIDRFDVALLPAARHKVMNASFPLKFFEYLLRGRPVVARPIPSLAPFGAWFTSATSAGDFTDAIGQAVRSDSAEAGASRRAFALGFGWTARMRELVELRGRILGAPAAGGPSAR